MKGLGGGRGECGCLEIPVGVAAHPNLLHLSCLGRCCLLFLLLIILRDAHHVDESSQLPKPEGWCRHTSGNAALRIAKVGEHETHSICCPAHCLRAELMLATGKPCCHLAVPLFGIQGSARRGFHEILQHLSASLDVRPTRCLLPHRELLAWLAVWPQNCGIHQCSSRNVGIQQRHGHFIGHIHAKLPVTGVWHPSCQKKA